MAVALRLSLNARICPSSHVKVSLVLALLASILLMTPSTAEAAWESTHWTGFYQVYTGGGEAQVHWENHTDGFEQVGRIYGRGNLKSDENSWSLQARVFACGGCQTIRFQADWGAFSNRGFWHNVHVDIPGQYRSLAPTVTHKFVYRCNSATCSTHSWSSKVTVIENTWCRYQNWGDRRCV